MTRSYAQFSTDIWRDADFIALPSDLQRIYMLLSSQKDISAAGVLPLAVNRWAQKAPDTTPRDIAAALDGLAASRFVVYDRSTEEVFVRSFVRWDNGYKNPKRLHAIRDAADGIESAAIVAALAAEFERLEVPLAFRGQCGSHVGPEREPPPNSTDEHPSSQVDSQSKGNTENQEGASISRRRVPQPTTHNPQPVPPPADSANAQSAQAAFEGMPSTEVAIREETDEQVAYRLARAWKKLREDQGTPIPPRGKRDQDVVFPLKNLIKGTLIAKYTEDEINEALQRCDKGIPSGQHFDDALKNIRRESANNQGPGGPYLARRAAPDQQRRSTSAMRAEQALAVADELDRKYGHGKYAKEGIQ